MSFTIYPIGDSAVTLELDNILNEGLNKKVLAIGNWLRAHPFPGLKEVVTAYHSVSIFIDPLPLRPFITKGETAFQYMRNKLQEAFENATLPDDGPPTIIKIPVCYDERCGIDLQYMSAEKNIAIEEIIHIHHSTPYRVYMIGFLPGFAYLGKVDDRIAMPRKKTPRQRIEKGSVGIAGIQTGIYPLETPGGWQIIGRTPMSLFNPSSQEIVPFRAGDYVQFFPITYEEFNELT